jgi:hypothetical protein
LQVRPLVIGGPEVTDEEKKRQAEVLALIAKMPKDATIEDFNRVRMNIVFVPPKERMH